MASVSGLVLLVLVMWRTQWSSLKADIPKSVNPTSLNIETGSRGTISTPSNQSSQLATYTLLTGTDIHFSSASPHVKELAGHCMKIANLDWTLGSNLVAGAEINADYFFKEFSKAIPQSPLPGHRSHCWKESFSVQWNKLQYSGHLGNISFSRQLESNSHRRLLLPHLNKIFPKRNYQSNLICLPNLFLAGFPKCGSTFMYCFISKLISFSIYGNPSVKMNVEKEPHFWVVANANKAKYVPTVDGLAMYLLNFLPGLWSMSQSKSSGILLDSTPNYMFNWPRFRKDEHDLTNYCLIPSVLPQLLPDSKYVVIMRNPIKMLYSAFWFSCTTLGVNFPKELLLKGPDLFHDRVKSKVEMFNNCMKNMSMPHISHTCELGDKHNYNSCIQKRLHLLDKCTHDITFNLFSPELPSCGRSRVAMGLYYVHIRKWLSVLPRDRFYFITLEELIQDHAKAAHDVLDFLDLNKAALSGGMLNRIINSCRENAQSSVDYKHIPELKMRNDTESMLEHFYYPFNLLLANLLGRNKPLW